MQTAIKTFVISALLVLLAACATPGGGAGATELRSHTVEQN